MAQNSIIFTDNLDEVLAAVDSAISAGLVEIGATAQGYAKDLTPVRTGTLRDSIGVEVNKDEIESVEYDSKIHCHLVSLKNDVNIGDGKLSKTLEIPDFFSKETLSEMFGK